MNFVLNVELPWLLEWNKYELVDSEDQNWSLYYWRYFIRARNPQLCSTDFQNELARNKAFIPFSLSPFSPFTFIFFFKISRDAVFQEQLQINSLLYFLSTFKYSWTLTFTPIIIV